MSTLHRYQAAAVPLTNMINRFGPDDWAKASACADWTAVQLISHIVDTQRDMFAGQGFDVGPAPDVAADAAAAWHAHRRNVEILLADEAVSTHAYDGFFGPTTVGKTLETFYIFDMVIHRWDLARALGSVEHLSTTELDAIEKSLVVFGPHMYSPGLFVDGVAPADPNNREQVVLARMGRS